MGVLVKTVFLGCSCTSHFSAEDWQNPRLTLGSFRHRFFFTFLFFFSTLLRDRELQQFACKGTTSGKRFIYTKNDLKWKKRLCVRWLGVTNLTWEIYRSQSTNQEGVIQLSADWFVLCDLWIFSGKVYHPEKGVLWLVYRLKKGGGSARGFSTVWGAPQNGDGRVEADFAIMHLTAQPHHKICIFSNMAPKNLKTREMCTKKATRSRCMVKNTKSDLKSPGLPWRSGGRLGVQMSV